MFMKQFKKCKVVMLPTKKQSKLIWNTYKFTSNHGSPLEYVSNYLPNVTERGYEYQHLYFLSNEEIDSNDIIIHTSGMTGRVLNVRKNQKEVDVAFFDDFHNEKSCVSYKNCTKVIASTDTDLNLPSPSKGFILTYCKRYNTEPINEVNVKYIVKPISDYAIEKINNKYEFIIDCSSCIPGRYYLKTEDNTVFNDYGDGYELGTDIIEVVKVDNNNNITIKSVKNSWTKEEVINLCLEARKKGEQDGELLWDEWINDNILFN